MNDVLCSMKRGLKESLSYENLKNLYGLITPSFQIQILMAMVFLGTSLMAARV